ncbi:hypothetical protein FPZ43_15150 [Mucilaginibacter pallidiroseus]|uniref:Uncharacterized protein n=1 Tax=Mucilaginibacter pallidiroseus TaxID=2599295 RepID=A0A563U550_9SPHI|nr:hypothetical protein [Mucilaginibacter pallidiroseus]TWR26494.1 hypothetical protein FPZ43_15150 [Mucilaginibacter pallidiroseus]
MTKPANDQDKPSPSDTPTERPADDGHKAVIEKEDRQYNADEPEQENIAKRTETQEQPINPVKSPPAKNQPDASDDDERRLESK